MQLRSLRLFLSVLLSVSLVWAAAGRVSAAASAQFGPLTAMVICAHDGETRVVLVDARGEPVDPAKPCAQGHCNLCVSSNATGLVPPVLALCERPKPQQVIWSAKPTFDPACDFHPTLARAPPIEI
jgi:hypothetical protein